MISKPFPRLVILVLVSCVVAIFYLWQVKKNKEINIIIASANGNLDEVVFLSQIIDDFNYVSIKGDTPLNTASKNGHLEIVKYLVENGARIDLVDVYGNTASMLALEGGHIEILEYLNNISEKK